MGGEQAASVLATVRREGIEAKGGEWSAEDEAAFKAPIRRPLRGRGQSPYFATARLWDDGIIDPAQTRDVLGLSIAASLNAPIPDARFGVFPDVMPMKRLLIANRGEIARRVIRTASPHGDRDGGGLFRRRRSTRRMCVRRRSPITSAPRPRGRAISTRPRCWRRPR